MKKTAIDIIKKIMVKIDQPKPSHETMRKDLQLMRFKIRPLTGDISNIQTMDSQIVEILWQIGQIDNIIHTSFDQLDDDDQERLLEYLQHIELKAQQDMKSLIVSSQKRNKKNALKIEIFKDSSEEPFLN